MRSIRKLIMLGLAALMICAAVASSASAQVVVDDASTGTALAVGSRINAVSTDSKLTGSFFGIATTVTCNPSTMLATVTANSGTPTATVDSITWANCKNGGGTPCTVSTVSPGWTNALMFNSTTDFDVTVPTNGGVQITGTGCLPLSSTCTFGAGQTVTFTWDNSTSTATVNASVSSPTCGPGTWTGSYVARTGATAGSGNFLNVT